MQEALPLWVAKNYTSIKRNGAIQQRLDSIFDSLSKISNAKRSKRGDRIYIPYTASKIVSPIQKSIGDTISDKGYKIKDYVKGIAVDGFGREVKLGKVLTRLNQPDLLNKFNTDTARASSKSEDTYIVFSKHPYDIAGQSTDRDWTSCMDLYDGLEKHYVKHDVRQGAFVAYYISSDDLNINNPIGRINIKPFINIKDEKDVIYATTGSGVYGNPPNHFKAAVDGVLSSIQKVNIGLFKLDAQLHCDWSRSHPNTPKKLQLKTKQQVEEILSVFDIRNYTINEDLTVDVEGEVDLSGLNLEELPVNFGKVTRNFDCSDNKLTSLSGAPKEVGWDFDCGDNKLTSLDGAPKIIGGDFSCAGNSLTSLNGVPITVLGDFKCSYNKLTSLDGAPKQVGGDFSCAKNYLTSLEWAPTEVGKNFDCSHNKLISLKGAPKVVNGNFNCNENNLTSLKWAPIEVEESFSCSDNKLTSLEGAPKIVKQFFYCAGNSKKFTEEEVRAVCDVKRTIIT